MTTKLAVPKFVKVADLQNATHGYNVKVVVLKTEREQLNTYNGKKITLVKAVVADETGQANALFKLENPDIVSEGKVIAIRNGRRQLIKGHISLETDIFGLITAEKDQIKANTTNNISAKQYQVKRREQGQHRQNRGHREHGEHREHREHGEHRQHRHHEHRENRKENGQHEHRQHRQHRGHREHRQHEHEHRQRKPREERGQKKQYRQNREHKPREEPKDQKYVKIADIEPGDENIYTVIRIVQVRERVQKRQGKDKIFLDCVIGDQTGVSDASFFNQPLIKKGAILALKNVNAKVVREHIQIQRGREGRISESTATIGEVNLSNNISKKAYVEA